MVGLYYVGIELLKLLLNSFSSSREGLKMLSDTVYKAIRDPSLSEQWPILYNVFRDEMYFVFIATKCVCSRGDVISYDPVTPFVVALGHSVLDNIVSFSGKSHD